MDWEWFVPPYRGTTKLHRAVQADRPFLGPLTDRRSYFTGEEQLRFCSVGGDAVLMCGCFSTQRQWLQTPVKLVLDRPSLPRAKKWHSVGQAVALDFCFEAPSRGSFVVMWGTARCRTQRPWLQKLAQKLHIAVQAVVLNWLLSWTRATCAPRPNFTVSTHCIAVGPQPQFI